MHSLLSLFLLTASCAVASATPSAQTSAQSARVAEARSDPFPTPREGLKLAADGADGGQSMLDLVNQFSRVTNQTLVIDVAVRTQLQGVRPGINRDLDVAPADVYFVVETLLAQRGYVVALLNDREPRMMGVYSIRDNLRSGGQVQFLRTDDPALCARHPALLVTTVVDLPYLDVRTLSNSMRSMFQDHVQQVIPVGNSNSLLISGRGADVATAIETMRTANELARADLVRREAQEKAARKESDARDADTGVVETPQDPGATGSQKPN